MAGILDTSQSTQFSMLKKAGDGDLMISSLPLLDAMHNYEFKFQCPALFIAGGKSLLLESKIMKYIREAFKDSMTVEVIENAAHHVPLDSPLELVSLINNYLQEWGEKK